MPQIDKVLTISSLHITLDTSGKLDVEPAFCPIDLSIFPKRDWGWWILVEPCIVEDSDIRTIPEDLMDCIRYAWKHDCTWICLDWDGEIIPELKTYNWEE